MDKPEILSDHDVERLGKLFVASGLHESYGVTFKACLNAVTPVIAYARGL